MWAGHDSPGRFSFSKHFIIRSSSIFRIEDRVRRFASTLEGQGPYGGAIMTPQNPTSNAARPKRSFGDLQPSSETKTKPRFRAELALIWSHCLHHDPRSSADEARQYIWMTAPSKLGPASQPPKFELMKCEPKGGLFTNSHGLRHKFTRKERGP